MFSTEHGHSLPNLLRCHEHRVFSAVMVSAGGRSSSPGLSGTRYEVFASLLLAVVTPAAYAADSLVRIDCLDETDGAAVYLDGEYQLDCEPFAKRPILTQAGEHEVTVVKPLDREYERVFAQTLELRAGEPQRVRVSLPARTLTAYGREQEALRREQARIAAEKAEKAKRTGNKQKLKQRLMEEVESEKVLSKVGRVTAP
mgnify:CR=1 FL=1